MSEEPREFNFSAAPAVLALGIRVLAARIENLQNRDSNPDFERLREATAARLKSELPGDFIKTDPVLAGYRQLHEKVGRSNRRFPAAPESLISLLQSRGVIPKVNLAVDIYNLVSIESRLALGAHDLPMITGDVTLRFTDGSERFVALGGTQPEVISPGEYCYVDDSNEVICRLEHKQVEKTKVTLSTGSCLILIQGNAATDPSSIERAFERLAGLLAEYCGATTTQIWKDGLRA